jgi:hypothetical protein
MARKKPPIAVVCDASNNTPETIAAGNVVVDIEIDPRLLGRASDTRVSARSFETARELATIPPEALLWAEKSNYKWKPVEGSIVRLRPPADATDEAAERVRSYFVNAKAARVIVLPRPRAELVPDAVVQAARGKAFGARDAVASLVAESNSKDGEALSKLCEKVMSEVGL